MKTLPVSNEGDFFNDISLDSGSIIALGTPGHIIDITEGIYQHNMWIGPLICKVGDYIDKHPEEELEMCAQVNQSHQNVDHDVQACKNEY